MRKSATFTNPKSRLPFEQYTSHSPKPSDLGMPDMVNFTVCEEMSRSDNTPDRSDKKSHKTHNTQVEVVGFPHPDNLDEFELGNVVIKESNMDERVSSGHQSRESQKRKE